jgi:plasmid stability protein
MAQLIVHHLEDEIIRQLELQAIRHGCSPEAEHRAILRTALGLVETKSRPDFKRALLSMPHVGTDEDFQRN